MSESNRKEVARLIRASAANLEYFFENQDDSRWLSFLIEAGFFRQPPPPERGTTRDGEGWIRFPNWPESRYLSRIASMAPELVLTAVELIPESENPRVHQDIVSIATRLPGASAARLAHREQQWLASYEGHLMSYPGSTGALLAHLAQVNEMDAAFGLAGTLLKISPAPEGEARTARRKPTARFNEWTYGKILKEAWPSMMSADPVRSFRFLCHRLSDVVRLASVEDSFDPTYIWRSAIEDHAQNTGRSLLDTVIDAVRDFAISEAGRDQAGRELVIAELAAHKPAVFRRLELFVLKRFGSQDQISDALRNPLLIDEVSFWHEYAELLRSGFGQLTPTQKAAILDQFEAGPDREWTDEDRERGISEEDFETRARYWRLERLALIAGHLEGSTRADYESLSQEFGGDPPYPTFRSVITSWSGPTSPFSDEELAVMGPARVVDELRDWVPGAGREDPSREGLGRILEIIVAREPAVYAELADSFLDLNSHYVSALLGGFDKALKEGGTFSWSQVLVLCEQVSVRPDTDGLEARDENPPSRWLKRSIASLIGNGLSEGVGEIPFAERPRVWLIIDMLLANPDPAPERDAGTESDWATVAINSVRGEALHAAVRYGLWIERALGDDFRGSASMPEVASKIDHHLKPDVDRSPAIRAVLGQWFPQLVRMDEAWARSLGSRVFPIDGGAEEFFEAAWDSYVVFNRAWIPVFDILVAQYRVAIDRLVTVDENRSFTGDPTEGLGEHLFLLRTSDSIGLEEEGLFASFWSRAPAEARTQLLRNVGWSLENGDPRMSEETKSRFEETWEWIFSRDESQGAVLAAFGAWFGGKQLDVPWLLREGLRVLETGVHLDPDFAVFKALERMSEAHPREVLETLRLMVINDDEGWAVGGSTDEVRQTLSTALATKDPETRSLALAVIDLLGAKGIRDFRDLRPKG